MGYDMNLSDITPSHTLAEALEAYAKSDFVTCKSSPRAAEPYETLARAERHKELAQRKLEDIGRKTVATWRDSLSKAGYSRGTIDGLLSKLRKLGDRLVDYEAIDRNVFREVGNARPTEKKRQTRVLDEQTIAWIAEELGSTREDYKDAWLFACETAMRCTELAEAKVKHLDRENKRLWVPVSMDKARRGRWVHLTEKALSLVRGTEPEDALVTDACQNTLRQAMWRAKVRTGQEWFWHLARHTAVSKAAKKTESLAELMAFSGHSTLAGIQGYIHVDEIETSRQLERTLGTAL